MNRIASAVMNSLVGLAWLACGASLIHIIEAHAANNVLGEQPNSASAHFASNPGLHHVVCLTDKDEAEMKKKETALLGSDHAAQHSRARAQKCRVAKGLEKIVKPDTSKNRLLALPAGDVGRWSEPFNIPAVGITSVLLHTGKVLFWSYDPVGYGKPDASNTGVAYVWDPLTRTGRAIAPPENIWCGGQTILSDGRVFIAGGNLRYPDPNAPPGQTGYQGALATYIFNPLNESWIRQPDMIGGRWYPTLTKLADNRVVITSGYNETGSETLNHLVELFTPSADMDGVGTIQQLPYDHNSTGYYPLQYLLPSGDMLQAGPDALNSYLLKADTWQWQALPGLLNSHRAFPNGISYSDATVTPPKQVVMVAGGVSGTTVLSDNEWLDGNYPAGGWRPYPRWLLPRHNANTVILPDGTLFTVGGNSSTDNYSNPLFESELYNKAADDPTGNWVEMAPNTIQAAYHSSAILLPDATVLLSQDDMDHSPAGAVNHQAQIYSPPYLFKGRRPSILRAPDSAGLGQTIPIVADSWKITGASLVAPGAVTHANDMHQRFIKLKVYVYGSIVLAKLPSSSALVPPGYYMLFLIDSKGVPSIAKFVRIT